MEGSMSAHDSEQNEPTIEKPVRKASGRSGTIVIVVVVLALALLMAFNMN
jgi:hypothetical protein